MKNIRLSYFALLFSFFSLLLSYQASGQRFWVAAGASNWNNTANWSTTSGGTGGASVPGAADLVTFNANGLGNCTLDIAPTIAGITVNGYTGTININGFNLTTTGNNILTTGTITNGGGAAAFTLNTVGSTTFNGTTVSANVNGSTGRILFNGSIFNGTVTITKTDNATDNSTGNNTFNGAVTLTHTGTGQLLLGNGNRDQFFGPVTFNNNSEYRIYFGHNHNGQTTTFASDVILNTNKSGGADAWSYLIAESANSSVSFGGNLTINCGGTLQSNHRILQGTGSTASYAGTVTINLTNTHASTVMQMGTSGVSTYNGNIIVTNPGGTSGIQFNTGLTSASTLATGRTISIGGAGFNAGTLNLARFTQTGATNQTLTTFSGTAALSLGPNTEFNGNVNFIAPRLFMQGGVFNGTAYLEKNGANGDGSAGNTTFASTTSIVNSGSGNLRTNGGNTFSGATTLLNSGSADLLLELTTGSAYTGNLTLTNTGTSYVRTAYAGTNTFNSITVNSTNGTGVYIGESATSASTFSGTLSIGGLGFSAGDLYLARISQAGVTPVTLTSFTGTTTRLYAGPASSFNGTVNFTAPRIFLNGATYNGTARIEKTGSTGDNGTGGNIFQSNATLIHSGSSYFNSGGTNRDQFFGPAVFNVTNDGRIILAESHTGQTTTFASTVTLNSSKTSASDPWAFRFAEGIDTSLEFNGTLTINCSGDFESDIRLANGTGSSALYNGNVIINMTNTFPATAVSMGVNGTSTYNQNIVLTNTGGANGVFFNTGANGSSTLAATKTITISGGFTSGSISLVRFTQTGTTAQALTATGTTSLVVGPNSQFNGNVNFSSPRLFLSGCTYAGVATLEKTGAGGDFGAGGNIFQTNVNITHSGSSFLVLGETNRDQFFGPAIFNITNDGRIHIAQNHGGQTTTFATTVALNSNKTSASEQWGFLYGEGANTAVEFNGRLVINCSGNFRSEHRFLNGTGSSAVYNDDVVINLTNTLPATFITMGQNGTSTYNQNIQVSNTGGAGGVFFNNGASSSSTLAATKTITIGGAFTSGTLGLARFTQIGPTPQALALISTGALVIGPSSQFDGDVNFSSPRLFLHGCTYGGTATLEKNGALNDAGNGGNVFMGATSITNSGSGYLYTGNGTRDRFLTTTVFNSTGSDSRIYFAHNHSGQTTEFLGSLTINANKSGGTDGWSYLIADGANSSLSVAGAFAINCTGSIQSNIRILDGTGTSATYNGPIVISLTNTHASTAITMGVNGTSLYNGNISVANTGGASGVTFNANASASSVLNGAISSPSFTSGNLNLYRFTQAGAIAQNLTLTTNGTYLRIGPSSSFDGAVTFASPRLLLQGAVYNGITYLEKTGNGDDAGSGGNTFNNTTTLVDSGSGFLGTANTFPDIFQGDLTITNTGSNWIYLAHNVPGNQFNGNIIVNNTGSALGIRFSDNATGASTFNTSTTRTISVGGSGFATGDLWLRRMTQVGTAAQALTLTGAARLIVGQNSEFNGNVNFQAPRLYLYGCRYNGTAYLEKTSTGNDDGLGGNTFALATTIANSGSGYLLTASTSPDTFNGPLTILNSGSSTIRLADNATGNLFNENIELNSTSGGGIWFGNSINGTSTLAAGKTIAVGTTGFITGDVRLIRFTQVGPTPQTLDLGGIAILTLGPSSRFGGNVIFRAPQLYLNGTTYEGTSTLEKKGAGNNDGIGGNRFIGAAEIIHSGSGYLVLANNQPDIFEGALTATNTGSNVIYLAHNVAGNEFRGNITFNSTLGSGGVYFSNNATGSSTLGNGASLLTGGLGFSSGELRFRRFTQTGAAPQTLLLTGTALMRIGPTTTFNGILDFRAPQFILDGGTFNGVTYLEKTGAGNNDSNGGNSFLGTTTTIVNSGSGWFRFAVGVLDTFGTGNLILTNTGTSQIRMADNVPGTVFNGNIFVNSTNATAGSGIYFGNNAGGTASLATGRTISIGSTGFALGDLIIRRFTQADAATPQTLLLTGTSRLIIGPTIAFSGNSDFRAPQLFLEGGIFNGTAFLEKTGATDNGSTGNMTFQSTTTIRNSGTGYLRTNGGNAFNGVTSLINTGSNYLLLELASGSTYTGNLTITNTGTSNVRMAYTGTTAFNGNIVVNSTSGLGVYFVDSGTGSATLANGRTISVGGTGFTAGTLLIQRFTQTGGTAQNITLTGAATFNAGPTNIWNGNLTVSSPIMLLNGNTFNGTANSFTKTGTSTDNSAGGNLFSTGTTTTIVNSGTGIFRLANTTADDFAGHAIFNQVSGTIQPAYNIASTFQGNVTVNSTTPIVFGTANGGIIFSGSTAQSVIRTGTSSPTFRRLVMNKAANSVTLNTDANVTTNATFTAGVMNTTATNILNFVDDATSTGGSNASHVDGPIRKTGNDAFSFPTGDNGIFRAIAISAPSNAAHFFTAEYNKAAQGFGGASTYATGILTVSSCEYWTLDRNPVVGGSNVNVTLSWNSSDCTAPYITAPADLRVVRWNGTQWVNHGNGGITGNAATGTVVTSAVVTSFSPFTLGSTTMINPLPVELLSFTAVPVNNEVDLNWATASELNNDFFEVQRSVDGIEFQRIATIDGAGTIQTLSEYQHIDKTPLANKSYYRLKQTDFDGRSSYSRIVAVNMAEVALSVHPNPVNRGTLVKVNKTGDFIVTNTMGVIVLRVANSNELDISALAPGVYTIMSSTGSFQRLVVQ